MSESEYEKAKRELHEAARRYRRSIPAPTEQKLREDENSCSFCGKFENEVKNLVAGPAVFICNECIILCNQLIDDKD